MAKRNFALGDTADCRPKSTAATLSPAGPGQRWGAEPHSARMPGRIVAVTDRAARGCQLLFLQRMRNSLVARFDGAIKYFDAAVGGRLRAGYALFRVAKAG